MNEQQIKDWLGVGDIKTPLRTSIVEGMTDVPVPADNKSQVEAFTVFLRCSGPRGASLWEKTTMRWHSYDGTVFTTPYTLEPTGQAGGYVHRLVMPAPAEMIPPVTWCGREIHGQPGTGKADCPDCGLEREGMS